ncbi:M20/M25/M40 family metallo-hydrolase [Blastococcus sp. CT_GayMR19]|uniref:M20/M25/M40 family metallo-hydrolase n=1 Tax=Blastococcus sp. CT_GayMR19 TaxID=2559608 RepID=UPI001ADD962E|nr:M20/M25/M40 family metallo-hydrolase [Blastococcus sp. CT_GayMR19]
MTQRRTKPARRTAQRAVAVGTGGMLVALLLPGSAATAGGGCGDRANDTYEELLDCVTLEGVRQHQEALQEIATKSEDPVYPGTRAAGTEGYRTSVEYVAERLEAAGYEVTLDEVEFEFEFPAALRQLEPVDVEYETGVLTGSGSATVEGPVIPVDINLAGDRASTSGCEAEDFAGLDFSGPADIALIQRGTCTFGTKAQNADTAGAEAVITFNQGNAPDRMALVIGSATSLDIEGTIPAVYDIPVVGASFDDGVALAQEGSVASVEVQPSEIRTDHNVIAELPGRNTDNVVMAGAHLDSVTEGPGINDNGSGSAALLETALMMAESEPENTLRFGWWAAEELGLLGSADYVEGLSQEERDRIALYLNYDMVGSPNHVLMVYDSDQSTYEVPAEAPFEIPEGSVAIEDLFESYYTAIGEPYDDTAFSGRSDYEAFILAGIPSGGLFTGAEQIKTEEQAAIWGGTADEQFDPCYHLECDTFENNDDHALEVNGDLIAFAMLTYAYSTETVNGVPGEEVPGEPVELPEPAGPEGTFAVATP